MAYQLDTNIIVFCLRGKSPLAMHHLHSTPSAQVRLSGQARAELLVGAAKSARPEANKAAVLAFISPFDVIWPDEQVTEHYVSIRAELEGKGTCISEADLWIAASARAVGDVLVTNNIREFARVTGLTLKDWTVR